MRKQTLSRAAARRVALAAQGFGRVRPDRPVGVRDVQAEINRLGQFQIDSINVVTRAHFMPLFSRLGPYDSALLERAAHLPPRRLFEYWGHAASLIDVTLQPALRFRMAAQATEAWGSIRRIGLERPDFVARVRDEVAARGPVSARELDVAEQRSRTQWGWNWSAAKTALELLFFTGQVASARRNSQFERVYDLPERVLPRHVLDAPTPTAEESVRQLVRRAAKALGVADEAALRDYFRTRPQTTRQAVVELVEAGELLPVQIEGAAKPGFLWHDARLPRRVEARALLSPFDSLVFERARLESLFDFVYRIEIYVPEAKRLHGYYVYPFLLGDRFVARVDLKADRARDVLRVNSAWSEPVTERPPGEIAEHLMAELVALAGWQGLSAVEVVPRGDLAPVLLQAARSAPTMSGGTTN